MKVVFVSNFLNHHQKPMCDAMIRRGIDFSFISYGQLPEERIKLGYQVIEEPHLIRYTVENHERIKKLILEAGMAIFGLIPPSVFDRRVQMRKLSFLFSERLFKKGRYRMLWHRNLRKKYHCKNTGHHLYLLCASAYTAGDFRLLGFPSEHAFKWGYFPRVSEKQ